MESIHFQSRENVALRRRVMILLVATVVFTILRIIDLVQLWDTYSSWRLTIKVGWIFFLPALCLAGYLANPLRPWLTVTDTDLVIRGDKITFRKVPIGSIRRIKHIDEKKDGTVSRFLLRALSAQTCEQLEVTYGVTAERVVVAPVDQEAFVEAVRSRNPGIDVSLPVPLAG